MDINLTGQILNLPFSLTGHISDSPWYYPLINPLNWLPLLVVMLGAYVTYFYTNRLEDRKNQYNLKVKIYFELLDLVNQLVMNQTHIYALKSMRDINEKNIKDDDKINHIASQEVLLEEAKELTNLSKQSFNIIGSLYNVLSKLQVICNKEVYRKTSDFYFYVSKADDAKIDAEILAKKQTDLTGAIRKDLGGEEINWFEETTS